ncbi:hypothetical protein MKX01_022071 [Papaver californicum]|nr:hypothetical protein MKX01_022071 [Papaver californicum]
MYTTNSGTSTRRTCSTNSSFCGTVAPPQIPPYVEPVPPPRAPPVFTLNEIRLFLVMRGYTVSTPVGDCSECNERCKSGSFKDDLQAVFCYDTSARKPYCNCCVRYGADDGMS